MKQISIVIAFYLFTTINSVGQSILLQKTLTPPGSSLKVFSSYGVRSSVAGATPNNPITNRGFEMTPAIEFADVKGNGFVIRKDYLFTKYNEEFEKEWETKIEKVYGLQASPIATTIGRKDIGVYFVQIKTSPANEIHITRFDEKGRFIQTEFKTENICSKVIHSFVSEKGLNLITSIFNYKEKKIINSLITFSYKDLNPTIKPISLDYDDYEIKNFTKTDQEYSYTFLKELNDKVVLQKVYFKDIEKTKNSELIIKTVEIDFLGDVANQRSFVFTSFNYSGFLPPKLMLDSNDLYVFGYLRFKGKMYPDGFYLNKFDYSTGKQVFCKQFEFKNIKDLKETINGEPGRELRKGFIQTPEPYYLFPSNTYYFDISNRLLKLMTFEGTFKDKHLISLNSDGKVVEVDKIDYVNPFSVFPDYILTPSVFEVVYKKDENQKGCPLDFINKKGGHVDSEYFFWTIIKRKNKEYDILISVKESDSEIRAYQITKE